MVKENSNKGSSKSQNRNCSTNRINTIHHQRHELNTAKAAVADMMEYTNNNPTFVTKVNSSSKGKTLSIIESCNNINNAVAYSSKLENSFDNLVHPSLFDAMELTEEEKVLAKQECIKRLSDIKLTDDDIEGELYKQSYEKIHQELSGGWEHMSTRDKTEKVLLDYIASRNEALRNCNNNGNVEVVTRSYISDYLREANPNNNLELFCLRSNCSNLKEAREEDNPANECLAYKYFKITLRSFNTPSEWVQILESNGSDSQRRECIYCNRNSVQKAFLEQKLQKCLPSSMIIHNHSVIVDVPGEYASTSCLSQSNNFTGLIGNFPFTSTNLYTPVEVEIDKNTKLKGLKECGLHFFVETAATSSI